MILPVIVASITDSASLSIAKKKRGINGGNSIQIKFATIAAIVFDAGGISPNNKFCTGCMQLARPILLEEPKMSRQ